MPRTGIEPKPPWSAVPISVRQGVVEILGSPVQRAMRVWGGYAPTPTFRLRLADGRRAFFKGVSPADDNPFMHAAFRRELRVYEELRDLIGDWSPTFYGGFERAGWSVMLLEDLGPKSAPPWTPRLARDVVQAFGRFHLSSQEKELSEWLLSQGSYLSDRPERLWGITDPQWLESLAGLAGERAAEALDWLERSVPVLAAAAQKLLEAPPPRVFLHEDLRSDNLRWVGGRLYMLDWPHVRVGPGEEDAAAFAQSVTVEGGPDPERIMAWYAEVAPVRADVLDGTVAALAGFFADQAWGEEIPGLPRLRDFQRRQLAVCLHWAAQRLDLPPPTWTDPFR